MEVEEVIANILKSSHFDLSYWPEKIPNKIAHELVVELIRAGWKIVPIDYETGDTP